MRTATKPTVSTVGGDSQPLDAALAWVQARVDRAEITPGTASNYRTGLRRFCRLLDGRPPASISEADIDRYLVDIGRLSPGTRCTMWTPVNRWCAALARTGTLGRNPCEAFDSPSPPASVHRALNGAQATAMMAVCRDSRDRLILQLGFQAALRRAEMAGLETGDVDLLSRVVTVRRGKGGKTRHIPMTVELEQAVRVYLADRGRAAGPLLRGDRHPHRAVSAGWVDKQVRRIAEQAGVKHTAWDGVATHSLRHTAATDVYEATNDMLACRELLGHARVATTERYVGRLSVERLRARIEGRHYGDAA